jgi:hypothetical protein
LSLWALKFIGSQSDNLPLFFFSSALLFVFSLFDIDMIAIFIDLISWLLVFSWKFLAFRFALMGIDVY